MAVPCFLNAGVVERLEFKEIAWYRGRKCSAVPCFLIAGVVERLEFKEIAWYRGRKFLAVPCFLIAGVASGLNLRKMHGTGEGSARLYHVFGLGGGSVMRRGLLWGSCLKKTKFFRNLFLIVTVL